MNQPFARTHRLSVAFFFLLVTGPVTFTGCGSEPGDKGGAVAKPAAAPTSPSGPAASKGKSKPKLDTTSRRELYKQKAQAQSQ